MHTMGSTIGTWPEVAIHENEMGSNGKEKRVKRGERSGCTGGVTGDRNPRTGTVETSMAHDQSRALNHLVETAMAHAPKKACSLYLPFLIHLCDM